MCLFSHALTSSVANKVFDFHLFFLFRGFKKGVIAFLIVLVWVYILKGGIKPFQVKGTKILIQMEIKKESILSSILLPYIILFVIIKKLNFRSNP